MRIELTDTMLRALHPPARGRLELWDATVRGLALRVTKAGVCTWSVRARTPTGERIRVSLGKWPAMGIRPARTAARVAAGQIAVGKNLNAEKRAARQTVVRQDGHTVSARLAAWREARGESWSERYRTETARLCSKIIEPKLGDKLLIATTRDDWVSLVTATRRRAPSTGTWLYQLCSSFLNYAESAGWIGAPLLPRKGLGVIAPRAASRARILSDSELAAVWHATEALTPKTRAFARALMMTAGREAEVADLAVGELDLPRARATFPAHRTKNKRDHIVPLHPLVVAGLQAIWPHRQAGPGYRLFGAIAGSGFRGFSGLKTRLDRLSGVSEWRWHDLRRTARSAMGRLGVAAIAAEAALNHVSGRSQLERVYDRYDYASEALAALEVWQRHVAELVATADRAEAA
jgi:integrase